MTGETTHIHTTGSGSIVDDILGEMPIPQQNAIDQFVLENPPVADDANAGASAQPAPAAMGPLDDAGESWNPDIHATGADGGGIKTAKGLWRKRRGIASSVGRAPARATAAIAASTDDMQSRAAGAACAHSIFMMGRVIGGPEWEPRIDDERNEVKMLESAFGDYFVAKNYKDFPPGLALTMAVFAYAAPRFTMPQTQSRMTKFKAWAAGKWVAWREKRKNRAAATAEMRDVAK